MKVLITGHRDQKMVNYDLHWIRVAISSELWDIKDGSGYVKGYSGMASGVDLMFCEECILLNIKYVACIPFEEQSLTMTPEAAMQREQLINSAIEKRIIRNSWMVEEVDMGIVVWDGGKGGTHNVVQQLIENKKPFVWINPVGKKTWKCY
jgi:hypothetical protein